MRYLPVAFQIGGLIAIAVGLGMWLLPLGIVAAGAGAFLIGFVLDQDQRGTP